MSTPPNRQLRVLSVIIILDLLSATMTVPLFPIIIADPTLSILGPDATQHSKAIALAIVFVLYAVAQLIGAPYFGGLSDRFGRKKMLAWLFMLNMVQYILIAVSIISNSFALLVISRTVVGFAGGTVFIQQSAIADMSSPADKAKNLGVVGIAFGIGLILGPILGTVLANPDIHPSFSLATPFFAILVINTINLYLLFRHFRETLKEFNPQKMTLLSGFKNLYNAFRLPQWRVLFTIATLLAAGLFFFLQYFQYILMYRFHFTTVQQGLTLAYCGLIMVIAQGYILPRLTKLFPVEQLLLVFLLVMGVGYTLLSLTDDVWLLFTALTVLVIGQGICTPGLLAVISNKAEGHEQGAMIGINQSVQSFASAVPAALAATLVARDMDFPLVFGAAVSVLAFLVYYFLEYKKKKPA
jgi:DHA1 family tetracycline resistance protein-like MFS transporter